VSSRVSPTDRIRADIDALFAEDRDLADILEDVARLGARLILQTAVEAEVTEFLGRDRYARATAPAPATATATRLRRSRPPPARSSWPARSCAAPTSGSRRGCSART
jgi:hypothetical protein